MPVLEFFPIETKRGRGFFPRFAVPAVGQDDTANIPKEGGDFGQAAFPPVLREPAKQTFECLKKFPFLQKEEGGSVALP